MDARSVIKSIDKASDAVIVVVCVLLMLLGAYALYDNQYVYNTAQNRGVLLYKPSSEDVEWETGELVDDVVAWLTIDDTTIDYPIVQGVDNQEYLNKDVYGNFSLSGSVFLDARCAEDFSDHYSLLYGHHMAKSLMFGALDKFIDESYFNEHRTGTLRTETAEYRINIFAVVPTETTDKIVFMDQLDYTDLIDDHIRNIASIYEDPGDGDVICMSTCVDSSSNQRLTVFGTLTATKSFVDAVPNDLSVFEQ